MNLFEIKRFFSDEDGLTVVEYVIGAGLVVSTLTGVFLAYSDVLVGELGSIF